MTRLFSRMTAKCGTGAAGQRRPARGQRRQGQAPRSADLMAMGNDMTIAKV
jgi:hypothetical protein